MGTIWEHLTPQLILQFFAVAIPCTIAVLTVVYKLGKQDMRIADIEEKTKLNSEVIKGFHGKCDLVTSTLSKTVTEGYLREHCKDHQLRCERTFCIKIKKVEEKVDNLAERFDHQQEKLDNIYTAIGRLEGSNTKA